MRTGCFRHTKRARGAPYRSSARIFSTIAVVEQLSEEMTNVTFNKMDVDQNPNTPQEFGIMSIPTLVVKKDGQVVDTIVGYHSKEQLSQLLNQYL